MSEAYLSDLPPLAPVSLIDVSLRDGLQLEKYVTLEDKLRLYHEIAQGPWERIELTSFAHPRRAPQFSDSDRLSEVVFEKKTPGPELMAFVPNRKGLERALVHPFPWLSFFQSTSETFLHKNVRSTYADMHAELTQMVKTAREAQRKVRVYISTVFGCPYEKETVEKKWPYVRDDVLALQPDEIALSDTIGVATPASIRRILEDYLRYGKPQNTVLHLHNTYGHALANAWAGSELGITRFDGTLGGLGGCPFAQGATGNVGLEDLVSFFGRQKRFPLDALDVCTHGLGLLKQLHIPIQSQLGQLWQRGAHLYNPSESETKNRTPEV